LDIIFNPLASATTTTQISPFDSTKLLLPDTFKLLSNIPNQIDILILADKVTDDKMA